MGVYYCRSNRHSCSDVGFILLSTDLFWLDDVVFLLKSYDLSFLVSIGVETTEIINDVRGFYRVSNSCGLHL